MPAGTAARGAPFRAPLGVPRRLVAVLVVAGALLGAACSSPVGVGGDRSALDDVRDTLRQRARQLLEGDAEGYLRDVGPGARPVEELIARGAQAAPLASIDLVFNPPRDVPPDGPEFRDVPVRFSFTYEGAPADNRLLFTVTADFEKEGDRWVETRAVPSDTLPLWATGPVEVTRSPHFVTIYRPGHPETARAIALAEEGRSRLLPRLTVVIDDVHVMTLASGAEELLTLYGPDTGSLPLAFAHTYGATGSFPIDRYMVVDTGRVLQASPVKSEDGRDALPREVFQHELGHLALSRYNSRSLPGWVSEGAAMYLAEEHRLDEWRDAEFRTAIQGVSFAQLSETDALPGILYPYANAAVLYLVDKAGPQRFWDFYRSFIDLGASSAPSSQNTNTLMKRFFGLDEEALDVATQAYIAKAADG